MLANRVLWEDDDCDMAHAFLGADPDKSRRWMQRMRSDPDYYAAVVEDPAGERLKEVRRELGRICGRNEGKRP